MARCEAMIGTKHTCHVFSQSYREGATPPLVARTSSASLHVWFSINFYYYTFRNLLWLPVWVTSPFSYDPMWSWNPQFKKLLRVPDNCWDQFTSSIFVAWGKNPAHSACSPRPSLWSMFPGGLGHHTTVTIMSGNILDFNLLSWLALGTIEHFVSHGIESGLYTNIS